MAEQVTNNDSGMSRLGFLLAVAIVVAAPLAWAEETTCRFGENVRRVELRIADERTRLPCEVVYWKRGEPSVLWRAETEAGYCESRAEELVETLESSGWICGEADAPRSAEAGPAEAVEPAAGPSGNGGQQEAEREQLRQLVQEAVARDLARLNELTASGSFDAEIAALGDLDGDGRDDAAVVVTYSNGSEQQQYLMAYMHQDSNGPTYLPMAKVAISGRKEGVRGAEVEAIEGGAIRLELEVAEPGDPECCPSGRSRATFVVQDGQLVELPTSS